MSKDTETNESEKTIKSRAGEKAARKPFVRKSFQRRGKLFVEPIPGYALRWEVDELDNIQNLIDGLGYEFVLDEEGKKRSVWTRRGDEKLQQFLLKQPLEIRDEIEKERQVYRDGQNPLKQIQSKDSPFYRVDVK